MERKKKAFVSTNSHDGRQSRPLPAAFPSPLSSGYTGKSIGILLAGSRSSPGRGNRASLQPLCNVLGRIPALLVRGGEGEEKGERDGKKKKKKKETRLEVSSCPQHRPLLRKLSSQDNWTGGDLLMGLVQPRRMPASMHAWQLGQSSSAVQCRLRKRKREWACWSEMRCVERLCVCCAC